MDARQRLLEQFESLSPRLRAAARFAVDHPSEVVMLSMRALAARADVQPASLVRLAQQLGFAGWPELKTAFARDMGLHGKGYGERAKNLAARGRRQSAGLVSEMFAAQQQNLETTEAQCAASLQDAAALLRKARTVHVAGFRASFPIAFALFYGYRLFRDSVALIDGQGGNLEMQLRPLEAQDALVVTSFAPYSREARIVLEAARAAGARIVALTDSHASPLALAADVAVLFCASSPSFFPSVAAAVAVSEALLELLVAQSGPAVAARIDRVEQGLFNSGAYLQAPPRRHPRRAG